MPGLSRHHSVETLCNQLVIVVGVSIYGVGQGDRGMVVKDTFGRIQISCKWLSKNLTAMLYAECFSLCSLLDNWERHVSQTASVITSFPCHWSTLCSVFWKSQESASNFLISSGFGRGKVDRGTGCDDIQIMFYTRMTKIACCMAAWLLMEPCGCEGSASLKSRVWARLCDLGAGVGSEC